MSESQSSNSDSPPSSTTSDVPPGSRPSLANALRSPSFLSHQAASLLMLLCALLPSHRGCGGSDSYPYESLLAPSAISESEWLLVLFVFAVGVAVSGLLFLVAIARRRVFLRRLFWSEWSLALLMITLFLLVEFDPSNWRQTTEILAMFIPPIVISSMWIMRAVHIMDFPLAWGRLQTVLFGSAIVCLHLIVMLSEALLAGYYAYMICMLLLLFANNWMVLRMEHDFFDNTVAIRRFRFSLLHVFVWISVAAMFFGYYQGLHVVLDWLWS